MLNDVPRHKYCKLSLVERKNGLKLAMIFILEHKLKTFSKIYKDPIFILLSSLCFLQLWNCGNATSLQLKVIGNQLVTASGSCPTTLRGVDISGLEYNKIGDSGGNGSSLPTTNIDGVGMYNMEAAVAEAVTVWGANFVRLPLNQDFWFGCQGAVTGAYQGMVESIVNFCNQNNVYVLLDLIGLGPQRPLPPPLLVPERVGELQLPNRICRIGIQ